MAKLALSKNGQEILRYPIPGGTFTVGREGTLELDSPMISRLHLQFDWEGTRLFVTDISSVGTRLNHAPLERGVRVPLRDGAVLEFGPYSLCYLAELKPRKSVPTQRTFADDALIGESAAMGKVRQTVAVVAHSRVPVLITGETGTGKGEAARAIHAAHPEGPLVSINMASIVGALFESELFGHEQGAFTGADSRRAGAFQQAHGGTLFLDEIGELPLSLQPKLLTALEERTVRRVGAVESERVKVRVIAATNQDLERMVAEGTFRDDLFSRLNCVRLPMPPLRARRSDIPRLVQVLLERAELAVTVSDAAMDLLVRHPWPDNVRGLRNALQRAAVFAREGQLEPQHFDLPGCDTLTAEKIRDALVHGEGERGAAKILGLTRTTLKRRMKEFGIPPRPRGRPGSTTTGLRRPSSRDRDSET